MRDRRKSFLFFFCCGRGHADSTRSNFVRCSTHWSCECEVTHRTILCCCAAEIFFFFCSLHTARTTATMRKESSTQQDKIARDKSADDRNIYISAPVNASGPSVLLVLVPGALVPIQSYVATLGAVQTALTKSSASSESVAAYAVIVYCVANLCDPLFDLNDRILTAIDVASKKWNIRFAPSQIAIMGHSLGAVGARNFVDSRLKNNNEKYAGLAMFGVCLNGDNVDGILGYPLDFAAYPTPLLALAGELDFTPISHVGLLFAQWAKFSNATEKLLKIPIVVPSMDHSDFCPGKKNSRSCLTEFRIFPYS